MNACRYHSVGRLDRDVTIQTCWDADRLDLGRVGITPKSLYLGSSLAKDHNFIEMERVHAFKQWRFVKEGFSDDIASY